MINSPTVYLSQVLVGDIQQRGCAPGKAGEGGGCRAPPPATASARAGESRGPPGARLRAPDTQTCREALGDGGWGRGGRHSVLWPFGPGRVCTWHFPRGGRGTRAGRGGERGQSAARALQLGRGRTMVALLAAVPVPVPVTHPGRGRAGPEHSPLVPGCRGRQTRSDSGPAGGGGEFTSWPFSNRQALGQEKTGQWEVTPGGPLERPPPPQGNNDNILPPGGAPGGRVRGRGRATLRRLSADGRTSDHTCSRQIG